MITDASTAWLIHKRNSGDTSALITVFTRENGLLRCLYKGGRTPKRQASMRPFIPLWLGVNQKGEWYYVRQLEIIQELALLKGDALISAFYLNELIYYALRLNDAHPELYDAYDATIRQLAGSPSRVNLEMILRRFEWCLITACGYHMSLTTDREGHPIDAASQYCFVKGEGFSRVAKGFSGQHILAFARNELNSLDTLKAVKRIMRLAIDHAIDGRPIKARELYG